MTPALFASAMPVGLHCIAMCTKESVSPTKELLSCFVCMRCASSCPYFCCVCLCACVYSSDKAACEST